MLKKRKEIDLFIIFYQCYCKLKYVCPDKNNLGVKNQSNENFTV